MINLDQPWSTLVNLFTGNGLCGDGGPATKARLMYPKVMIFFSSIFYLLRSSRSYSKGLVVDTEGNTIFADGRRIRKVIQKNGTIITIAGQPSNGLNEWQPQTECQKHALSSSLQWPTDLAINPSDQSLFIIDGGDLLLLKYEAALLNLPICHL